MNKPDKKAEHRMAPAGTPKTLREIPEPGDAGARSAFSVRMAQEDYNRIQEMAAKCGYTLNNFLVESALACIAMIDAEPGKEIPMPKIVRIGRALKWTEVTIKLD